MRTKKDSCVSETSLIQTIGRAARNAQGKVIMYADSVTPSMAPGHSTRRSAAAPSRQAFNEQHGIVPKTIYKSVRDVMEIFRMPAPWPCRRTA